MLILDSSVPTEPTIIDFQLIIMNSQCIKLTYNWEHSAWVASLLNEIVWHTNKCSGQQRYTLWTAGSH